MFFKNVKIRKICYLNTEHWKQHCQMLQVERFFQLSRTLLRHCCWCKRSLTVPSYQMAEIKHF